MLSNVLKQLNIIDDNNLLLGMETTDDAAVYKINDDMAIVYTLDFFTPIVNDPYTFGKISAANSLSDVYAMGCEPLLCLNIVGFPNCMDESILTEILRGSADKVAEAGCILAGGHTIQDDEPKFGLSVIGLVHPREYWRNNTIEEGDVIFLTKPIGVGVLNTALKGGLLQEKEIKEAIQMMEMLNKVGYDAAKGLDIHACTDITGFGLAGHAYEMTNGTNYSMEIYHQAIPFYKECEEFLNMGLIPEGTYANYDYVGDSIRYDNDLKPWMKDLLFDPQTSGGLLFSLPESDAIILEKRLKKQNIPSGIIGKVIGKEDQDLIIKE